MKYPALAAVALAALTGCPDPEPPMEPEPPVDPDPADPADPADPEDDTSITIFQGNAPLVGYDVLFQHADGQIVARSVTDDQGRAEGATPAGGMVTVIAPDCVPTGNYYACHWTITGVEPGDVLSIGDTHVKGDLRSYRATLPAPFSPDGDRTEVDTGCGWNLIESDGTVNMAIDRGCFADASDTDYSILAVARDEDFNHVAFSFLRDVPVGNQVPALPAWSTATEPFEVVYADRGHRWVRTSMYGMADGVRFEFGYHNTDQHDTPVRAQRPAGFAEAVQVGSYIGPESGQPQEASLYILERRPVPWTELSIDLAEPPRVNDVVATMVDGALTVSWSVENLADVDGVTILVYYHDERGDLGRWWAQAADTGSFTFPPMPAELAASLPSADRLLGASVTAYSADYLDGYQDLRERRAEFDYAPSPGPNDQAIRQVKVTGVSPN